jgi:hypothetical protein
MQVTSIVGVTQCNQGDDEMAGERPAASLDRVPTGSGSSIGAGVTVNHVTGAPLPSFFLDEEVRNRLKT